MNGSKSDSIPSRSFGHYFVLLTNLPRGESNLVGSRAQEDYFSSLGWVEGVAVGIDEVEV